MYLKITFGYWCLVFVSLNFDMNDQPRIIGSHIYIVDEIGSTNTELLENAHNYEHGSVICARKQTSGRGRHKRDWKSQNGGLYFSILLKDQKNISKAYPLVLLSALSVVKCIKSCATQGVAIKWPNDVYINHRKVCGILAESATRADKTDVVIGIGLNVNNSVSKLEGLRNPAVSLKECRGEELDLNNLLDRILGELDHLYKDFTDGGFPNHLPELNRLLYSKGQEIELNASDSIRKIIPLEFTEEAKLRCLQDGVETTVYLGEL